MLKHKHYYGGDLYYLYFTRTNTPLNITSVGGKNILREENLGSNSYRYVFKKELTKINDNEFNDNSGKNTKDNLLTITLPNTITSIGNNAFYKCCSLSSIELSNSLLSTGSMAFSNCTSLTSITIPSSFIKSGYNAFSDCNNLARVDISDLTSWCNIEFVTNLSNPIYYAHHLYLNNVEITDLTIPSDVINIEKNTFYSCMGLTTVTIPDNVESIGDSAFYICSGLLSVVIGDGVTSIGDSAFSYSKVQTVTFGSGIVSIGSHAFNGCYYLSTINNLPNTLESIGSHAFWLCNLEIQTLSIPNSCASIGDDAFGGCDILSLIIPKNTQSIGRGILSYNLVLASITVDNENTIYDSRNNCNAIIETATNKLIQGCKNTTIPNDVVSIEAESFSGARFSSILIPNSVTRIGDRAFDLCYSLTSIEIPSSVISISSGYDIPFKACNSITSIVVDNGNPVYDSRNNCNAIIETSNNRLIKGCANTVIPNTIITIGGYAFHYVTTLVSINIPDSVTSIGESVFSSCWNLQDITIGTGIQSIGSSAFSECRNLISITCFAATPPSLNCSIPNSCNIYVPSSYVSDYQNASGWSSYASKIQAISS